MFKLWIYTFCLAALLTISGCQGNKENRDQTADSTAQESESMRKEPFGKLPDGTEVNVFTVTNKNGLEMKVINYGGIITSLKVPDKDGNLEDVVLGFDSLSAYVKQNPFFGALVGRYGNRIANGKFVLDGKEYSLVQNNNGHHLHGGTKGFDKVYWKIEKALSPEGPALRLTYNSKDMEEGYPGNLAVEVIYTLTDKDELKIDYKATTDKRTVVNLTQHTYFNLTGNFKRDILNHELMLKADQFVPVDKTLIPKGGLANVKGTPFDFNTATKIGARINDDHEQLKFGQGYDHCWVLSSEDSVKLAGSLYEPTSGRLMEVYTTEPGVQFYSGNFLDGSLIGKGGVKYTNRFGMCLETEHFPNSPNRPDFPSVVLDPGEVYRTQTIYRFEVQ